MKNQALIKRYAHGLLSTLKGEKEYGIIYRELKEFSNLLAAREKLYDLLTRPLLPVSRKKKIAEGILSKSSMQQKTTRFILLLIENDRLELLSGIIEFLPDLWNKEKGIVTYEVLSVVPLTDSQEKKLQDKLEHIENKPVALKYKKDPSLIGGISLRKGNIVYDVSIKGDLERLREQIIKG